MSNKKLIFDIETLGPIRLFTPEIKPPKYNKYFFDHNMAKRVEEVGKQNLHYIDVYMMAMQDFVNKRNLDHFRNSLAAASGIPLKYFGIKSNNNYLDDDLPKAIILCDKF